MNYAVRNQQTRIEQHCINALSFCLQFPGCPRTGTVSVHVNPGLIPRASTSYVMSRGWPPAVGAGEAILLGLINNLAPPDYNSAVAVSRVNTLTLAALGECKPKTYPPWENMIKRTSKPTYSV